MKQIGKTQIMRHAFIDRKIREGMRTGRYANSRSMAAEYEVSYKSIRRDIEFLREHAGAPIAYDPSKKGFYYTEENYKLPAVTISAGDLFAICVADKVLQQHRETPVYTHLRSVFDRISASLPDTVSIDPSWVDKRISILQPRKTKIEADVWATVAGALQRCDRLEIAYQKPGSDKAARRRVDPYHLASYDGEWYLFGHCHRRGRVLTFAVSRIRRAQATGDTFTMPDDFDFTALAASRFGIFTGEAAHRIRVRFAPRHAPYVLERQWHPTQRVKKHADGAVTLEINTSHLLEVKRWVLSWGAGAVVLEPEELRAMVAEELRRALEGYEQKQTGER